MDGPTNERMDERTHSYCCQGYIKLLFKQIDILYNSLNEESHSTFLDVYNILQKSVKWPTCVYHFTISHNAHVNHVKVNRSYMYITPRLERHMWVDGYLTRVAVKVE